MLLAVEQNPLVIWNHFNIIVFFFIAKLTMIVGPVASGKSSLLAAIMGEMGRLAGAVKWKRY